MDTETFQAEQNSLEQENQRTEKGGSYLLLVLSILFFCSVSLVGFLVVKTTQLQKEIVILKQEAIRKSTEEALSQNTNSEQQNLADLDNYTTTLNSTVIRTVTLS